MECSFKEKKKNVGVKAKKDTKVANSKARKGGDAPGLSVPNGGVQTSNVQLQNEAKVQSPKVMQADFATSTDNPLFSKMRLLMEKMGRKKMMRLMMETILMVIVRLTRVSSGLMETRKMTSKVKRWKKI